MWPAAGTGGGDDEVVVTRRCDTDAAAEGRIVCEERPQQSPAAVVKIDQRRPARAGADRDPSRSADRIHHEYHVITVAAVVADAQIPLAALTDDSSFASLLQRPYGRSGGVVF